MMNRKDNSDPDLNIPVTARESRVISPFLNFDHRAIEASDQYILPEGAGHQRGRFEMAFAQIGASVMTGGVIGGVSGLYRGSKETKELTGQVRMTQTLNIVTKQAAAFARTCGIVALMYSLFGTILAKSRDAEDELNTVTAGTLTGLLFKSSAGLKPCLKGGAVGFSIASAYCLYSGRDKIKQMIS